ncbi:MAG: hypothetical protein AAF557_11455 [Pseudomonadota bacterium]
MTLLRSIFLAICLVTTASASDDAPDLDDWSDINTALKCAAFAKISKQPGYETFELMGLERLRSFFASSNGDPLEAFPFKSHHLDQVGLDSSVDFRVGVTFSVLYRDALEAIERQTHPTVIPDFPSVEQQEAAKYLYTRIECEALLQ